VTDIIHACLEQEHRILKAKQAVEAEFAAINLEHTLVSYRQAVLG